MDRTIHLYWSTPARLLLMPRSVVNEKNLAAQRPLADVPISIPVHVSGDVHASGRVVYVQMGEALWAFVRGPSKKLRGVYARLCYVTAAEQGEGRHEQTGRWGF